MEPSLQYDPDHKKLTVRNAREFPEAVFQYEDVEVLDMSFNELTTLPADIARLPNLRIAFFSHNDLTEVPTALAGCEQLEMVGLKSCNISSLPDGAFPASIRGIILTDNKLTELPGSIGRYEQLQKLMLTGNQLTELPRELAACQNLELLRVAANGLTASPDRLSGLPKLAWYTDSGNEYNRVSLDGAQAYRQFSEHDITLGAEIGASAKNIVYAGTTIQGSSVAVKIFGQGITTDGLPEDDIQASLIAGEHPNLIGGLGTYAEASSGRSGLVMPLVPDTFQALGLPPDLKTLTRDVYPQNRHFSAAMVVTIVQNIASALQHLHANGIMHGDIYAHNILTDAEGHSVLGDFGASSLYYPSNKHEAWRERVDVAGFGHLVAELVERCSAQSNDDAKTLQQLQEMSEACLASVTSTRPSFLEICKLLMR